MRLLRRDHHARPLLFKRLSPARLPEASDGGMTTKGPHFDKIKFSRHQRESVERGRLDHNVTEDRAAEAVDTPALIEIHGTRLVYWSRVAGRRLKTVVSATTSAAHSIGRVVASYWHEPSWMRPPKPPDDVETDDR